MRMPDRTVIWIDGHRTVRYRHNHAGGPEARPPTEGRRPVATITTTTVWVDPRQAPSAAFPEPREAEFTRPALHVGGVGVTVGLAADAVAAAWWRRLAAACEEVAGWYDQRRD
jgi:hypothetical protein